MSSPMMTRMLGFCCWACDSEGVTAASVSANVVALMRRIKQYNNGEYGISSILITDWLCPHKPVRWPADWAQRQDGEGAHRPSASSTSAMNNLSRRWLKKGVQVL